MLYVVGFLFSSDMSRILLIHKKRPEWMAGMYNGLGGKVEEYERPWDAMVREFKEECGLDIPSHRWYEFLCFETETGNTVRFYRAQGDEIYRAKTVTDECVSMFSNIPLRCENLVSELRWIIPMAIQSLGNGNPKSYHLVERR